MSFSKPLSFSIQFIAVYQIRCVTPCHCITHKSMVDNKEQHFSNIVSRLNAEQKVEEISNIGKIVGLTTRDLEGTF